MTDIPMPPASAAATGGPAPQADDEVARLIALHTHLQDTVQGFDKVTEKAEPEFLGVAEAFGALHRAQAGRVAQMVAALGGDVAADGSLMGTVNRAVVEIRSWFDDIGHNVMDALVDGEMRLLESFDAAISASPSPERRGLLQQMQTDLRDLLRRHAPNDS
ncbi:DUF2383 domain-containing protein [Rhodobaculum claviforme]|uniref:DUF2383 domain-containing protein n=1 Tax=Rhodobaculum claviforme TaxID=1549854 RepID=A0A934THW8_9RHOB|nr:DUF2383 domain-containing protein [Rhodobaculum claviforme]MBK5926003.1 hypothetical protein [Rhodobaculum claviforme]